MALVVQNDTGTSIGGNAYVDSTYVDTYVSDRNFETSEWEDLDLEVKNAAIISASSYIDNSNMGKLKGIRLTEAQLTAFPRNGLTDYDGYTVEGLPELLKMATSEYAVRAAVGRLAPDVTYDDTGIPLKSKKEKIGPIEETTVYQDDVLSPSQIRKYPEADMLLRQYIFSANYVVRG
jgi:hypothetical protein